jgi:hypothetical protein
MQAITEIRVVGKGKHTKKVIVLVRVNGYLRADYLHNL